MSESTFDRQSIHDEMERARCQFHAALAGATSDDLRRRSNGTKWTNEQLLFHMLFGYLLVRVLLVLVKAFGRLPVAASSVFATVLNSTTVPFHHVNYWASRVGARGLGRRRMGPRFDRVIASLHRHLDAETDAALRRGMHFPPDWDPYFRDFMTLADVYHYPTQHFDHHRAQLSL